MPFQLFSFRMLALAEKLCFCPEGKDDNYFPYQLTASLANSRKELFSMTLGTVPGKLIQKIAGKVRVFCEHFKGTIFSCQLESTSVSNAPAGLSVRLAQSTIISELWNHVGSTSHRQVSCVFKSCYLQDDIRMRLPNHTWYLSTLQHDLSPFRIFANELTTAIVRSNSSVFFSFQDFVKLSRSRLLAVTELMLKHKIVVNDVHLDLAEDCFYEDLKPLLNVFTTDSSWRWFYRQSSRTSWSWHAAQISVMMLFASWKKRLWSWKALRSRAMVSILV